MNIGIAYADKFRQVWLKLDMPEGSTVKGANDRSGLLTQFPEIDLSKQKIGIFGKLTRLDSVLEEGSRVEIYRPIMANPETVERRNRD
jgi:putative ubiquitin-RnfH superfamily antitoxin RatB of RatAB toxin-antitoxin module